MKQARIERETMSGDLMLMVGTLDGHRLTDVAWERYRRGQVVDEGTWTSTAILSTDGVRVLGGVR